MRCIRRFGPALAILAASLLVASCGRPTAAGAQGAGNPADGRAPGASRPSGSGAQGGGPGGGRRQTLIPVQAMTVQPGLLTTLRSTAGVVNPSMQSQVAAQVAGIVRKVLHVSGDWVLPGDIVVQLDDSQLRLSLANAEASLENAKINLNIGQDSSSQANPKLALQAQSAQSALDSAQKNYDAQKALFDLGGISASALDTAASQLSTAQANLAGAKTALDQNGKSDDQTVAQLKLGVLQAQNQVAQAQFNLQNASIRAPFAGQIAAVNMQSGMYVGTNTPVFTLVSQNLQINFSVSPSDAPALPTGTLVSFGYGGVDYPVKVSQAPSAPINGVVPMIASLPPSLRLPYGTVGSVAYSVAVARGILLPLVALETLENKTFVFRISEGRATTRDVTILGEAGVVAAVSGLSPGDVVAVNPPPGLIQGSQVQVIMMPPLAGGAGGQTPLAPAQAPRQSGGQGSGSYQGTTAPGGQARRQGGQAQQGGGTVTTPPAGQP